MNRDAKGFSLIELLVVISIIALMLSVLMPALASSQRQAKMLRELAASRQLNQAYVGYALDHDGDLIRGHMQIPGQAYDDRGNLLTGEPAKRWPWRLMRYINYGMVGSLLVNEQAEALADRTQADWAYHVSLNPSFGLNQWNLGGDYRFSPMTGGVANIAPDALTKYAQAAKPSRMIVFSSAAWSGGDGTITYGYYRVEPPNGWTSDTYHFPETTSPDRWGQVHGRWDGRAVVAHLDGHSELLSMRQMRDMTRWSNKAALAGDPDWTP